MASEFLPDICGVLMSHLFQRALFEYYDYNLKLIEKSWSNICDHCPLGNLLTATCPLYGHWLTLISRGHMWPLPHELLIKARREEQYFLGGVKAQQAKGQLISEQICGVLNFPKMQHNIARISALATKMGQIKKVNAHYHPN